MERAQISATIKQILAEQGIKMPQLAVPLRVAVTGRTQTPSSTRAGTAGQRSGAWRD